MKEENQNVQHVLDEPQHTIAQFQAAVERKDTHQGHYWLLQFSAVCEQIDAIIETEKQQRRQRKERTAEG